MLSWNKLNSSVSSVAQSCLTLCDPMDCSTLGLPVRHQLLELAQTHVHPVGDASQPSHPLSSPSPPAFNLAQHQSLQMSQFFTSGSQSIGASASTSVHTMNTQDWSLRNYAAAVKSLQLSLTLWDPRDCSPPGSPVPGILQARTLEWVAISFSSAWKWKVKVTSLRRVWLLATPWTAAH